MKLQLPFEVLYILWKIQQAGFEAYLVGGAVRDLIIHSLSNLPESTLPPVTDFDFTTNAKPEEIQKIFPDNFYENNFGTVGIAHENLLEQINKDKLALPKSNLAILLTDHLEKRTRNKIIDLAEATKIHASLQNQKNDTKQTKEELIQPKPFEITTYRTDGQYQDFRRPKDVTWGESINDDLNRRDFTINAMAIMVHQEFLKDFFTQPLQTNTGLNQRAYKLIDPHQGMKSLATNSVKSVRDADERFQEDALRMLRAIRFSVQLNMEISSDTLEAIKQNVKLIKHISWERISDEFMKMIASDHPKKAIELLDKTGLLELILPELPISKGVEQGGHHDTDVWIHSLDALETCPSDDPIVRLATLLHDIGKPQTYKIINGGITFYNHEIIGSRIASKIAKRLRLSKNNIQRVFTLVRYHMFHYQPQNTDASIRRFMRKVGLENVDDILDLREGDRLGSNARRTSWRLEEMKQRMIDQLHQPMAITDIAIDGDDLIKELGMKPGREIGTILQKLFEMVMDEPDMNEKSKLLEKAKKL